MASQQTGHNSGVVHAGIYYAPGSLKARLCVEGARKMYDYCERARIAARALRQADRGPRPPRELAALDELERRGRANGVPGLRRLDPAGIAELEPHCRGVAALHSPAHGHRGLPPPWPGRLRRSCASGACRSRRDCRVTAHQHRTGRRGAGHDGGEMRARFAVFCAGVAADRLAVGAGAPADPRIVPFRGAYLSLRPERRAPGARR